MVNEVIRKIEEQQKKLKSGDIAFYVGEQLKDICRREPHSAQIILEDLGNKKMAITEAEKKIAERARKNRQGNCGCVTPSEAEEILREFYGLGAGTEAATPVEETPQPRREGKVLDLADFL